MTKCRHKYVYSEGKECPHKALKGKDLCYWHEKRGEKNPINELGTNNFAFFDLQEAFLQEAKLQGAYLTGANLQGAYLPGAELQRASLGGVNLQRAFLVDARLQEASLTGAELQGSYLMEAELQGAILDFANLQETNLNGADFESTGLFLTKFDNSSLWSARHIDEIAREEIMGDEEQDDKAKLRRYEMASQIYRNLKNYFRNEGIYGKSGIYYYRERAVERKIHKHRSIGEYLWSLFLDLLCGYGEKPRRIIFSSLAWIFFNSFIYFIFGIEKGVTEIGLSLQINVYENAMNFLNCWYFSFVTFTTLGYGDLHPVGITKTFATIEAFTGVFMLALFVLTMGRKMMR